MNSRTLFTSSVVVSAFLAGLAVAAEDDGGLASRVVEMTGARTKIVWAHRVTGRGRTSAPTPGSTRG